MWTYTLTCMHPQVFAVEQKGRAKVYTLSGQGREELEKACKYFCRAFGDIFDEYGKEG